MTARAPHPVALAGRYVMLEPLRIDHVPDLFAAQRGLETEWGWLPVSAPRSQAEMRLLVEQRLAQQAAGGAFLFAVLNNQTRRPVGWIAYLDIHVLDERTDIGWHWLGDSLSMTPATAEIHLLLAQHAFNLGFRRVQWQLDDLDRAGHNTMMQLGAEREGLMRRHQRRPDGTWRDTVLYALLAPDRSGPAPGGNQLPPGGGGLGPAQLGPAVGPAMAPAMRPAVGPGSGRRGMGNGMGPGMGNRMGPGMNSGMNPGMDPGMGNGNLGGGGTGGMGRPRALRAAAPAPAPPRPGTMTPQGAPHQAAAQGVPQGAMRAGPPTATRTAPPRGAVPPPSVWPKAGTPEATRPRLGRAPATGLPRDGAGGRRA